MSDSRHYDAVIVGSGQGGKPLAVDLAQAGWRTALVEKDAVGGSCVNYGCTPTKTMVASARVAYLARRGADYGVQAGEASVDLEVVRRRKRDIVESFRSGSENHVKRTENLDLLRGTASFASPNTLELAGDDGPVELRADRILLNTGCRPRVPEIPGLQSVPYLNSTTIMELGEVPEHLVVLGGGYIGLEFGQMFRRFGSQVTVVQRGNQLLGREDADVAEAVAEILREDGVRVLLGSEPAEVSADRSGGVRLRLDGEQAPEVRGSHLLVATGRVPNSDTLRPEKAGLELDRRGFVRVDSRLETNLENVWALGDVKGGPQFTHISYDDYRILKQNLLEGGSATTEGRLVPYTVFIDPQLGRVGLSESEALERPSRVGVARMPMSHVARALEMDESRGFMKAVVDLESEEILGAAVLGIEGGELMSMLQLAMMGKLPYSKLRDGIFAHPTLAESLNNLFGNVEAAD